MMTFRSVATRRTFLERIPVLGGGAALGAAQQKGQEEEVSPNEDLMREHGILVRCLVIYREVMRRMDANRDRDIPPDVVTGTAQLIRSFVRCALPPSGYRHGVSAPSFRSGDDSVRVFRANVIESVSLHFEDATMRPRLVQMHYVKDKLIPLEAA